MCSAQKTYLWPLGCGDLGFCILPPKQLCKTIGPPCHQACGQSPEGGEPPALPPPHPVGVSRVEGVVLTGQQGAPQAAQPWPQAQVFVPRLSNHSPRHM